MMMFSLFLACTIVPSASLSYSSNLVGSRSSNAAVSIGAAIVTPKLQRGALQGGGQRSIPTRNFFAPHHCHRAPPLSTAATTSLHMALGGNYLENMDNDEENPPGGAPGSNENGNDFRDNNGDNRWGFFGNSNNNNNRASRGNNRDGGSNGAGGRGTTGTGTAIRPSPPPNNGTPNVASNARTNNNAAPISKNYGIGGGSNRRQQPQGVPRVLSIRQPQDLLDFVIQDERLSVVKVYASWCKTCQVFDVRYRKLASQLGDNFDGDDLRSRGRVRFAEMKFDDPNNEEMCRLLNATKLPYILMYKGSKGKVTDFQCGPAKFQLLIDAVNEHAEPEGAVVDTSAAVGGGEQEWSVVREQQQQIRNQQLRQAQQSAQYGNAGSITNYPPSDDNDKLKLKEEEISRLYSELSNLRTDFDKRLVQLKEEHKKETTVLNERVRAQTKEYEDERRALSAQIKELSREMMEREKIIQSNENAASQQLQNEMKRKEDDYKETLTGLNVRITELERDLFKSRNELQYNSDASNNDQRQLSDHIANIEREIGNLSSRNQELEKELIEEKRVVVASTEEASRVLKQLEKIKYSEDEERKVLAARIVELEADIANRERQMMSIASDGDLANEIQMELNELRKERDQERELMAARIAELEQELWQLTNSNNSNTDLTLQQQQQQQQLRQESERLSSRILELENEIDERDKLLRTSNKASDILLDNMEAQKRDYERELDRTTSLVNELEEAIVSREEEMGMLQERFDGLERMAEELKRREDEREAAAEAANTYQFQQQQQQQAVGGIEMGSSSFEMEQEARMAAEHEVGKLMGYLKDREEEIARMQQQQQGQAPPNPFSFGAIFGGIGANAEPDMASNGWETMNEESMDDYEMLKDVLMPDEVSPRMGEPTMPQYGAGRYDNIREGAPPMGQSENIWEGAGLSSLMSPGGSSPSGGRYDDIRGGAGSANTPSPSVAAAAPTGQQPTPAMAFERRLADNPIVPSGAFGGSKPTSSFFSQPSQSSGVPAVPSDTPDYYQNVISNFNNNENAPAMPPAASYEPRPTTPVPRGAAASGNPENIYAGAGSASTSTYPSPAAVPREEPAAPLPTPAMAFEQRLAENPIVPSGAFGGSRPTSHFFSPKPAPEAGAASTAGAGNYSTQPSPAPNAAAQAAAAAKAAADEEDDPQSKWQKLDDFEKKRVAAEAYKAFEKSLEDSRRDTSTSTKPKGGSTMGSRGGGGGGQPAATSTGGGGGSDRVNKRPTTAEGKNQSEKELERKKHQDMVKAASATAATKEGKTGAQPLTSAPKKIAPKPKQQSTRQVLASAAQASVKRMSLAERAVKADQDRKDKEKRLKAEARKAHEAKQNEDLQRVQDAKRNEEIKRAEELKRKADADLAAAAEAKAKAEDAEVAMQRLERERKLAEEKRVNIDETPTKQESPERSQVEKESLETKERIEAALLGAEEPDISTSKDVSGRTKRQGQEEEQSKAEMKREKSNPTSTSKRQNKKAKTSQKKATRVAAGGFAVSKYDVVVMKDPKNIDMPQLLEGSLKDLLKDGPPPKRRNRRDSSEDLNY